MHRSHLLRRYLLFFLGLALIAFGVAAVTKAALGTTPLVAIPYALSLILPGLSMGRWVILFNLSLVLIQLLLLRRRANKPELVLQALVTLVFGSCVDVAMGLLTFLSPACYPLQMLCLAAGCAVIALGAYCEVVADVVMLPGDGLARTIHALSGLSFGTVRVLTDSAMTLIAGVLCLAFLGQLSGVREGTIVAAVITGNIVKLYTRHLSGLARAILPDTPDTRKTPS